MNFPDSLQREIQMALGCPLVYLTEHGCVEVTRQIAGHVRSGFMVKPDLKLRVFYPIVELCQAAVIRRKTVPERSSFNCLAETECSCLELQGKYAHVFFGGIDM